MEVKSSFTNTPKKKILEKQLLKIFISGNYPHWHRVNHLLKSRKTGKKAFIFKITIEMSKKEHYQIVYLKSVLHDINFHT